MLSSLMMASSKTPPPQPRASREREKRRTRHPPLGSNEGEAMIRFEIETPLSFTVRITDAYWQKIITKHPDIAAIEDLVQQTLQSPDEVRQSSRDEGILLFYCLRKTQRWVVVVARRLNGDGFLITAYQTDAIKEGIMLWHK